MPRSFMTLPHWKELQKIKYRPQGSFGYVPAKWAFGYGISLESRCPLPTTLLTRKEVRDICQCMDHDVMYGYICAMAWGLQGAWPGGKQTVASVWAEKTKIQQLLQQLRCGQLTRSEAYQLFVNAGVRGLGPAYFTKLIYFFLQNHAPTGYIMDQWTAKSINLITQRRVVHIYNQSPTPGNSAENYESYCRLIETLGEMLNLDGDSMEQLLFSHGGRNKGEWRNYVEENWACNRPRHPYDLQAMMLWVTQICE